MRATILLVEDEDVTREGTAEFLMVKGYKVICACDGREAIHIFQSSPVDIVILDIMLPKMDGFSVLKKIREQADTSVLMLTAMNDETTQLLSFDEQADDYMSKPFSLAVLERRIDALLRRKAVLDKDVWSYKDITVDFTGYTAMKNGAIIDIKPREMKLLHLLITHAGAVLSREQILDKLWACGETPTDRVIDVYIKNLRKKLQLDCIKTVKGSGYKYEERT